MSLSSFISDIYNSLSITEVQAEAPAAEEKESQAQDQEEPKEEKEEAEEPDKEEEAEEEEEEEPQDPAPAITEECTNSKECRPYKHHYDECVERVTAAASEENATGPKEDCVEEFFHVLHCATACAAPKIFAQLK